MKYISVFALLSALFLLGISSCNSEPKTEPAASKVQNTKVKKSPNATAKTARQASIDTKGSKITWKGSKIGSSHDGTISLKSGMVEIAEGKITGGKFVIDMNSITNTDLAGTDGAEKLVKHLSSPDFFDVNKFPEAVFVITEAKQTGPGKGDYTFNGDFTLKGVTKPISFKGKTKIGGKEFIVDVPEFAIDRTNFDVRYGSNKFFDNLKDKVISDQIIIHMRIVGS